jgi:hypothetical protein
LGLDYQDPQIGLVDCLKVGSLEWLRSPMKVIGKATKRSLNARPSELDDVVTPKATLSNLPRTTLQIERSSADGTTGLAGPPEVPEHAAAMQRNKATPIPPRTPLTICECEAYACPLLDVRPHEGRSILTA